MIYLKCEKEAFGQVKKEFATTYTALLQVMLDTFKAKGKIRDTGSPIHHRQSPTSMLSLAQAKCRRTESILSRSGWETDRELLKKVIEECVDVGNYTLYIAALCEMLLHEEDSQ